MQPFTTPPEMNKFESTGEAAGAIASAAELAAAKQSAGDSPISVIGLGHMGAALARALLGSGHPTTVWNRTAGKAAVLADEGATVAATAADAVTAGSLIIVCVLDYHAVHRVLDATEGLWSGRTLVNLTNGTPEQARHTAARAAALGADYIDGGIMAIPQMIATPGSLVLYSGAEQAFTAHRDTLERLGSAYYLGADAGLAPLYDLALLTAMYGMFTGFFQSVALVGTEQVKAVPFTELVLPWLGAMMHALPRMAEAVDNGLHETNVSSLDINKTGLANLMEVFRGQGVSGSLFAPVQELVNRAVDEGYGAEGLSRLVELIQRTPQR